jgi:uncharacterized protein YjbI with pentapeptide repeats
MARPGSERPVPPRLPRDVPIEPNLHLAADTVVTGVTIQGDFSEHHLERLVVEDAHIVNSSFVASDLNHLEMVDVLVEGSDFSGALMEEATLSRVVFKHCRISGLSMPRSQMRDASFIDVRLDDVNLRGSTGDRVLFEHVNLERGDLYGAHFISTCFFDCDLRGVDVSEAKLRGARFHGSDLSAIKGGEYLRDIVIDSSQVLPLAIHVFAGLQIRVEDDRDREFE